MEENRVHDKEKNEIMEDIGSHQSKDYLATYKDIENERIELIYSQKNIEGENNLLREEKLEMEDKIEEDMCITSHLNEEIMRYRTALQEAKDEGKRSFVKSRKADKENINLSCSLSVIPCSKMTKSVDVDTTMNSHKNITILEEG